MALFDPDLQPSSDRGHLLTEQSNQRSSRLDQLDTLELVALFADEDRRPQEAVAAATPALAQAVDAVAERLRAGGRLFYLGAGTSGRLGVLDAAECPPTFAVIPSRCRGFSLVVQQRCCAVLKGSRMLRLPVRLTWRSGGSAPRTVLWGSPQVAPRHTFAAAWRLRQALALWRLPWPVFRRSRLPFPAISTFVCSPALSC